jgi:hypothetical protein
MSSSKRKAKTSPPPLSADKNGAAVSAAKSGTSKASPTANGGAKAKARTAHMQIFTAGDLDAGGGGAEKVPFQANPAHLRGIADMSQLIHLEEANVLENLKCRYEEQNNIYTSISKVLVCINPYQWFPLYGEDAALRYSSAAGLKKDKNGDDCRSSASSHNTHSFAGAGT